MADTRSALAGLAERERIGVDEAATLSSAYEQLRTVEHRLQMHSDRQTHSIPENRDIADAVARLHGLTDADAKLDAALFKELAEVGVEYAQVVADLEEAGVASFIEAWNSLLGLVAAAQNPEAG